MMYDDWNEINDSLKHDNNERVYFYSHCVRWSAFYEGMSVV